MNITITKKIRRSYDSHPHGHVSSDVIIYNQFGAYEYTGSAGGGFTPNVWSETDWRRGWVKFFASDFNGDGCTDFIVSHAAASSEYLGRRGGGFTQSSWLRYDLTTQDTFFF